MRTKEEILSEMAEMEKEFFWACREGDDGALLGTARAVNLLKKELQAAPPPPCPTKKN